MDTNDDNKSVEGAEVENVEENIENQPPGQAGVVDDIDAAQGDDVEEVNNGQDPTEN